MRLPYRAVGDYHVDRQEVYAQQCVQLTCTNRPRSFLKVGSFDRPSDLSQVKYCGGYSGEDPPLPIPNREVKLTIADGTAPPGGRVGSCRFSKGSNANASEPFFFLLSKKRMRSQPPVADATSPFQGECSLHFAPAGDSTASTSIGSLADAPSRRLTAPLWLLAPAFCLRQNGAEVIFLSGLFSGPAGTGTANIFLRTMAHTPLKPVRFFFSCRCSDSEPVAG